MILKFGHYKSSMYLLPTELWGLRSINNENLNVYYNLGWLWGFISINKKGKEKRRESWGSLGIDG